MDLFGLLIPFVYYIMIRIFFQPLSNFIHTMHESRQDNIHPRLSYDGLLVELNEFSGTFNHMMDKIEQLKIDSYKRIFHKSLNAHNRYMDLFGLRRNVYAQQDLCRNTFSLNVDIIFYLANFLF